MLEFSIFDIVIIAFANRYHVVIFHFAFKKKEEKSKNILRCFFLLECLVIDRKKEKSKDNLPCFFLLEDVVIYRKKKNRKAILVVLFLDRISSSFSSTSSFVISKSSFETQLFSSFSSFMFKDIAMMFKTFVRNVFNFFESRFNENFLAEIIHNAISSFVLSFRSFSFVSFFFASFFFFF